MKRLLLLLPFGFSVVLLGGDVGRATVESVGSQTVGQEVATQVEEGAAAMGSSGGVVSPQRSRELDLGLRSFLQNIRNGLLGPVRSAIQRGKVVSQADLTYARDISNAYNKRLRAVKEERLITDRAKTLQRKYERIIKFLEKELQVKASQTRWRE